LLRSLDGNEYHIEDSAAPVHDEQGNMIAVVMVFHNVSQRYAMLRRVREERSLFQQTFEQAAVGMAHVAPDGAWLRVNRKLCDILGYSADELLGLTFQDITHADDLATDLGQVQDMLAGTIDHYSMEKRYIHKNGHQVWVNLTVALARKDDGTPDYFISVVEDIHLRKDAEMTAEIARHQYQALFEQMPEGVLLFDRQMRVVSFNNEAILQLEYSPDELLNLHVWDIDAIDDQALVRQRAKKMQDTGGDEFESRYRTRSGRLLDVMVSVRLARLPNEQEVFQCLFRDIGEQKEAARQIEHLAYHDQLTGLANRRLLNDRMTQAINSVLRRDAHIGVLYLDLDHFKDINDSFGHQFGDALLKSVTARLHECVRVEDTLARIGGDEFVVMLKDVESEDAAVIAQKIIHNIALPMHIEGEEVHITPSIGISICPQDGKDADTLLKNADAALYLAKQQGRATYRFCTDALHTRAIERLQIERLLRKAIERNEFELYYQPKVNLNDGVIIGCEALIRWNHPGMGVVSPMKFIPVAEQSHLINEIGIWVMREACRQAALWQQQGLNLQVAFNVSARQFMRPEELLHALREALDNSGVTPSLIEIEMTESLLIDEQSMGEVLQKIRAMGVHLALDDFGTGYSSLSYLRRFPISILKIDRSFVSDADRDPDDAEMVKTIIGMANNLRMNLVAEGIETEGQRNLLCVYGCETGQGYHFSRPLPVAAFEAMVVERRK
jgi:diguanylate cyclase (GGDEF)-like protein/PAS domain S-box-containing protein